VGEECGGAFLEFLETPIFFLKLLIGATPF
jgi:hypothetical protein